MKTMNIAAGIRAIVTEKTFARFEQERKEREQERKEREQERALWELLQTMDETDPLYSDLYKDVHGVRPRPCTFGRSPEGLRDLWGNPVPENSFDLMGLI